MIIIQYHMMVAISPNTNVKSHVWHVNMGYVKSV